MVAPHPNSQLGDHHLLNVRGSLLNRFATTLHISRPSPSSNLKMCYAVGTRKPSACRERLCSMDLPTMSGQALGPSQPPTKWVPKLFSRG